MRQEVSLAIVPLKIGEKIEASKIGDHEQT
jgi:hypothetical protein